MATVVLTRLKALQGMEGREVFVVRGEVEDREDVEDVRIVLGETSDMGPSWYELPLPACPDCAGEVVWAEAGNAPGTRECQKCASLFSVDTERKEVPELVG